ncbi:hypothetical protein PUN28_019880 [Cardiocondyla obscurior]|uniref:Uncharacterized protein n=1 Tax=Cardiocondyla obscurior TaxID=286306 RepID=A0AAW2EC08_9HYME
MNELANAACCPPFASSCSHNASCEIRISKQIEIAFAEKAREKRRKKEQREPLLLRFLVRKQCLVNSSFARARIRKIKKRSKFIQHSHIINQEPVYEIIKKKNELFNQERCRKENLSI